MLPPSPPGWERPADGSGSCKDDGDEGRRPPAGKALTPRPAYRTEIGAAGNSNEARGQRDRRRLALPDRRDRRLRIRRRPWRAQGARPVGRAGRRGRDGRAAPGTGRARGPRTTPPSATPQTRSCRRTRRNPSRSSKRLRESPAAAPRRNQTARDQAPPGRQVWNPVERVSPSVESGFGGYRRVQHPPERGGDVGAHLSAQTTRAAAWLPRDPASG